MLNIERSRRPRRAGTAAWRIVMALVALCLAAAACTATDDADDAADDLFDSEVATTAASSDEAFDDEPDEDEASALAGGVREASSSSGGISQSSLEGAADEEMSDDSSDNYSGGATTESVTESATADDGHEPYEPPRRRRTEPDNFVDYGVNPFVDTADDPFSTFALDVDTAAYTIARNFLDGGRLPPFEAVRVEEFVNYFDGGYDDEIDEFTVSVDAAPSPFADRGDLLLRVGVQAPNVVSDALRPDSIILVLDSSGSMNQEIGADNDRTRRIELVYDAVDLLLDGLDSGTRVGVVAYADNARTVARPADIGRDYDELMEQLANRADGSYHYIDDHDEAWRLLGSDVTSFVSVAARDAKVQVIFNPDTVAAYRLIGFENRDVADRDFRNDAVDAGEIAIGQSATALYELTLVDPDSRDGRSNETLVKVTLRYERPASEAITEVSETIRARDAHANFDDADRHFRLAAVAAEFAEVLRQSWFVDEPSMRTLRSEAEALTREFRGDADVAELARLIVAAQRLQ